MGVDWESISARLIFGPATQSLRKSTEFKTAGAHDNLENPSLSIGRNLIDGSII